MPTDTNLLPEYGWFAELEAACEAFCEQVNTRLHRVTRRAPARDAGRGTGPAAPGARERRTRWRSADPHGAGQHPDDGVRDGQYSVPHSPARAEGVGPSHGVGDEERVVIVHVGDVRAGRGRPPRPRHPGLPAASTTSISRRAPAGALDRAPKAAHRRRGRVPRRSVTGARLWLAEAAAAGTSKMRVKMAEAVTMAKLVGTRGSTGRWGMPPSTAASPRTTWPRSWTTTPAPTGPARLHRAGEKRGP